MEIKQELKEKYWQIIRRTRSSGRIAQSVIDRVEASWEGFDVDVIEEALKIHSSRYPSYKESYTLGIMRNLQKQKSLTGYPVRKNEFNNFTENDYDFEALEKQLLAN